MNVTLHTLHTRLDEQNAMLTVLVTIIGVLALLVLFFLLAKLVNACCCKDARGRRWMTPGSGGEPTGSSAGSTNGSPFGSYQPKKRNYPLSDFIHPNMDTQGRGAGGFNGPRVYNGHGGGDGAGCA